MCLKRRKEKKKKVFSGWIFFLSSILDGRWTVWPLLWSVWETKNRFPHLAATTWRQPKITNAKQRGLSQVAALTHMTITVSKGHNSPPPPVILHCATVELDKRDRRRRRVIVRLIWSGKYQTSRLMSGKKQIEAAETDAIGRIRALFFFFSSRLFGVKHPMKEAAERYLLVLSANHFTTRRVPEATQDLPPRPRIVWLRISLLSDSLLFFPSQINNNKKKNFI